MNKNVIVTCLAGIILASIAAKGVMLQPFQNWVGVKGYPEIIVARCLKTPNPYFDEVPDTWIIAMGEITNLYLFAQKLDQKSDELSAFLRDHMQIMADRYLQSYIASNSEADGLEVMLVLQLDQLIKGPSLYNTNFFRSVKLSPETKALLRDNSRGAKLEELNRRLLEDAYPSIIARKRFKLGLLRAYWNDGVIQSDIEVVSVLKGRPKTGTSRLFSTYRVPQQGNYYLIFALYYEGHYQALEDYNVIPLGTDYPSNALASKTLDEKIDAMVQLRLNQLNGSGPNSLREKERLEKELQH